MQAPSAAGCRELPKAAQPSGWLGTDAPLRRNAVIYSTLNPPQPYIAASPNYWLLRSDKAIPHSLTAHAIPDIDSIPDHAGNAPGPSITSVAVVSHPAQFPVDAQADGFAASPTLRVHQIIPG